MRDSDWQIGNYDILAELGRGGMGVIYKARHRQTRRIVALKRVLDYHADSAETVARFRREAEAVASLDHPNILPIYDVGEFKGLPFFTMKLATGGSLQEAKRALRDDPRHCVWLLARVARAVQHAHAQGILHRDLKPGNILLDGWREPLVSDFGLAKWLHSSTDLTRTLTVFGTPGYIAPEQAGGPSAGLRPAADIYSLGAILFDLLTGRPPFLGRARARRDATGGGGDGAEIAHDRSWPRSRSGDDLREVPGTRSAAALRLGRRFGGGSGALARRPPHRRATGPATGSALALVETKSGSDGSFSGLPCVAAGRVLVGQGEPSSGCLSKRREARCALIVIVTLIGPRCCLHRLRTFVREHQRSGRCLRWGDIDEDDSPSAGGC